jgi:hypothetical protein
MIPDPHVSSGAWSGIAGDDQVMIPDPHVSSGAWSGIAGDDPRGPLRVGLVFR